MNTSLRTRRRRSAVGGAVAVLALGGLAAALPAHAGTGRSANSVPVGLAAAAGDVRPAINGGSPPRGTGSPVLANPYTVTDSLNPNGVTGTDAILTCATSYLSIGGTTAITLPVGCLTLYNGEWVKVVWSNGGTSTDLTMQTDGNLVLTPGNTVKPWASNTTFKGNLEGPGCLAQFQSTGNLVVSNCDDALIWTSAAKSYSTAVLAFQADGNFVIYENSSGTPLWASGT
ncbi:MAG TPA: hypothetical protein VFN97_29060 [Actinospica sp.]|nr:hypothetical protein [Actinospica sp.]